MTSFIEALQGFDFTTAGATQGAQISVGNGNNDITVLGDNCTITGGDGNNTIEVEGDTDSVLVGDGSNKITTAGANTTIVAGDRNDASSQGNNDIYQVGDNAKIAVGNGDNTIISYSNSATIVGGNGDNVVGSMGNNVKIGMGNGDNSIGFWGNNDVIAVGNGNNNVKTLDWLNGGPKAANNSSKAYNSTIQGIMSGHDMSKLKANSDIMEMASKVSSSFTASTSHTKQRTGSSSSRTSWTSGNRLYTRTTTVTNYLDTYITSLNVSGVKNPTIKYGSGNNDIGITATGGYSVVTTTPSQKGNNKIGVISSGVVDRRQETSSSTSSSTTSTVIRRSKDPLIIDFNQDGVVSATANQGIDLDGDGKADGAATGGDKMLAMSDINKNGQIDGAEVFGNDTVDPFTGKALNAKNGFHALELLAQSAEKHTSVKNIIDSEGNVNLAKLKEALSTKGINLGFVSDNNNSALEQLTKVASINVRNYSESEETEGTAHHAQQGSYVDENGNTHKVHDVWFHEI